MKRISLTNYKKYVGVLILAMMILSCEEILLEYDISQEDIILSAPSNEATLSPSDISFRWETLVGATSYEIQIARPDFVEPNQIYASELIEDNFFNLSIREGEYEWRVRGINSSYATAFSKGSFKVENDQDFSARRVYLLLPSDDLVTNQYVQEFRWDTISGSTLYRFQLINEGVLVNEQVTSDSSLSYDLPNGKFKWKVRAENDTQNTFYSERNILVDTISPNKPKLLKPEDSISLSNNTVNFEWEITGDNSETLSPEIDSIYIYKDQDLQDLEIKAQGVNKVFSEILDRNETYYWFVITFDQAGNIGEPSEVYSFNIE